MYAKIHEQKNSQGKVKRVTAVCDKELLGKVFEEKEKILNLKKYAGFYKGRKVSEKQAIELIKQAENLNLIGRKAVAAAKKAIGVSEKNVKKIAGVPHLQVYLLD